MRAVYDMFNDLDQEQAQAGKRALSGEPSQNDPESREFNLDVAKLL